MTDPVLAVSLDAVLWKPFASGRAKLQVTSQATPHGPRLQLDFDFQGEKGFIGIRRESSLTLTKSYAIGFRIGGQSPRNTVEFKLTDKDNRNVWRWVHEDYEFRPEGEQFTLKDHEIPFAWGPDGTHPLRQAGGIEFVIGAGSGGKGTVWIEDLRFIDRTDRLPPIVTASSQRPKYPAVHVLTSATNQSWRSASSDSDPWLQLEFHRPREFGGLILESDSRSSIPPFTISFSSSGKKWRKSRQTVHAVGKQHFVSLPHGESRFLRVSFSSKVALRHLEIQPFGFSRSPIDFLSAIARKSARGRFPRYLLGQQSYWTNAGVPDGTTCAIINEEGMVEPGKGSFSLEPFLNLNGRFVTWADARRTVRLERNSLPVPTIQWRLPELILEITPFGTKTDQGEAHFIRYRLNNRSSSVIKGRLNIAIRPFQVSPPWQSWKSIGGISNIRQVAWDGTAVTINRTQSVVPLQPPEAFGAIGFDGRELIDFLAVGNVPEFSEIRDQAGLASAAMAFSFHLSSGESQEIYFAVPVAVHRHIGQRAIKDLALQKGAEQFEKSVSTFESRLRQVEFRTPAGLPRSAARAFRTAAGQILINRNGPALQPGPRRYTRCWIRDSATMGAALLRAGEVRALAESIRWYAQYQRADGFVPCCVDDAGPDWLVEHDSHGQLIYAIMESYRCTRDESFLTEMWPHIERAAKFIESLLKHTRSAQHRSSVTSETRGLLPESASHEGYLAQPVHSYWDDFWAVRGLRDAAAAATVLNKDQISQHLLTLAEELRQALLTSIHATIRARGLNYVPGSFEWGDSDPSATANALWLLPDTAGLPPVQLHAMLDEFITLVRRRRDNKISWNNYSAYEIRVIGAFVRLGRRAEALELLEFYLSDRRPRKWNQWPEISWKNSRSPGHLGDIPHTWIAAEFMLIWSALFAYERDEDHSLVIGAGIDELWVKSRSGISVRGLPTWYGLLDLSFSQGSNRETRIQIAGELTAPPGGFVIRPPLPGRIQHVLINDEPMNTFTEREIRCTAFPADVLVTSRSP